MIVLIQDKSGFVDLDTVPYVRVFTLYNAGEQINRIKAVSGSVSGFWLGDYGSVGKANAVIMQMYEAKIAGVKDFVMPEN